MCGIAGIVKLEGFDADELMAMTDIVSYRGPDGRGYVFIDVKAGSLGECIYNRQAAPVLQRPSLGLGARRLAILDLSENGLQPMQIGGGDYWITYNGEIYNYLEIRSELEKQGERFRTHTDTEVILRAYRVWGEECVRRFNGMWAFAIWDRKQRKLFCSRDRFGVKPFYYFIRDSSQLIFASEIKQLLCCPGVPRIANERAVVDYLEQGVQDHSKSTFFSGISQLLPGHSLIVDLSQPSISIKMARYWELTINPEEEMQESEAIAQFGMHFKRSVSWRLRSDVPVGSCLSGGLDSSSVVMTAVNSKKATTFHSFSSCFEDDAIDERKYIQEVIASSGATSHLVFPQEEEFWDDLSCLIWHQDEPFGGTGVYAQWKVMQEARKSGVPVLLDGQGGDEILCGYRKFYIFYLWQLLKHSDLRFVPEAFAWLRNVSQNPWRWSSVRRYVPSLDGAKHSLIAQVGSGELVEANAAYEKVSLGPGDGIRQRQKDDLTFYSIPALLHYEDRNSMAHSIETRVPMLDYELAQFAVNCPAKVKLRNGWTKWMLRQSQIGTLPEAIRLRKTKLGFSTPQQQWLRQDVRGVIRSVVHESKLRLERILSLSKVREQFEAFLGDKPSCLDESRAFRVLNLELWARVFEVN